MTLCQESKNSLVMGGLAVLILSLIGLYGISNEKAKANTQAVGSCKQVDANGV